METLNIAAAIMVTVAATSALGEFSFSNKKPAVAFSEADTPKVKSIAPKKNFSAPPIQTTPDSLSLSFEEEAPDTRKEDVKSVEKHFLKNKKKSKRL